MVTRQVVTVAAPNPSIHSPYGPTSTSTGYASGVTQEPIQFAPLPAAPGSEYLSHNTPFLT